MGGRILPVQGHPDASRAHTCHALADACADGAREGGHEVRVVDVARLDVPVPRSAEDRERGTVPASPAAARTAIARAEPLGNVLGFVGIGPAHETLPGATGELDGPAVERLRVRLARLGRAGA
jgi:hypothetical protein